VGGVRRREPSVDGRLLRDHQPRRLGQFQPAVLLRRVDHEEPELPGLAQQLHHQVEIVVFQLLDVRKDLVADELVRRVAELDLLFGEILRGEDVPGGNIRDQVFAAFKELFGSHHSTSHSSFPRSGGGSSDHHTST
jgi:hypothetical protein